MKDDMSVIKNSGPMQTFQTALSQGDFVIQQCKSCGKHVFYPRLLCNFCGSNDLKWVEASGRGKVYSASIIHQRPEKGGDYNVVLIDLEEGPRMMSRIIGVEFNEINIGMAVNAHVGEIDKKAAIVFSVAEMEEEEW